MKSGMIIIRFILIFVINFSGSFAIAQTKAFDLFAVSDLANIFEDGYACPLPERAIDVFGIRDENISAQCVVKASVDLNQLTVLTSALKHGGTPAKCLQGAIEQHRIQDG